MGLIKLHLGFLTPETFTVSRSTLYASIMAERFEDLRAWRFGAVSSSPQKASPPEDVLATENRCTQQGQCRVVVKQRL